MQVTPAFHPIDIVYSCSNYNIRDNLKTETTHSFRFCHYEKNNYKRAASVLRDAQTSSTVINPI